MNEARVWEEDMGEKYVLVCEDSIDGIFTGVYDG